MKTFNDNIQNNEDTKDEVIQKEKTDTEANETTEDEVNENNKEADKGK